MAASDLGDFDAADAPRDSLGAPFASPAFELRCWGSFRLADPAGRDVTPRGRKARALVAFLSSRPGEPRPRERLAGLLWSNRGDEQARASLRQALHELAALRRGARPLILVGREHVRIDPELLCDSRERLARLARAGDLAGFAAALPEPASDLFSDLDGLDQAFDEWLAGERSAQRRELVGAAIAAAREALLAGDAASARAIADRICAFEPFDEPAFRLGLEADAAAGDRAAAGRRYAAFRAQLRSELGVDPSSETEALRERLLARGGGTATRPAPRADGAAPPIAPPRRRLRWAAAALVPLAAASLAVLVAIPRGPPAEAPASIAVLPFRNLAPGDDYFAEGVAEEILAQLAREPGLRVSGRTSTRTVAESGGDARSVGRRLGVDHVLDGSVRRAGADVRVTVALVATRTGVLTWSETYRGRLDDIFRIQQRIGAAVAANLRSRLARAGPPPGGSRATSGEVYRLYLIGRGMMRERESAKTVTAIELLREAVRIDPAYAPAWARLGVAVVQQQTFAPSPRRHAARELGLAHVRRALALAPDLAEAHAAMAFVLGADSPDAGRHIRRAAALDPADAEIQLHLGLAHSVAGEFDRAFAAYRRAAEIDPLYRSAAGTITRVAPSYGEERLALRLIEQIRRSGSRDLPHLRGHLQLARGDLSGAAASFAEAARSVEPHSGDRSDMHLGEVLRLLGHDDAARRATRFDDAMWRLWHGEVPAIDALRRRNRSCAPVPVCGGEANDHDGFFAMLAVKRLLLAGRGRELAVLYHREGLLTLSPRHLEDRPAILVANGPLVALALRADGRAAEADRLLAASDRAIRRVLAQGRVPHWFHADAAQTWALQGRLADALGALEQAVARGWVYESETALPDIAEEPAFHPLRGQARFERIRQRFRERRARERAELGLLPV